MDQEFSINKQDFTTIKEKIIRTNELLQLYSEKNEKLSKATQAFKQLKAKYESSIHETSRLKFDNERLNYSLEEIRPKYEQSEKDLLEVRLDLARVDEKYQQHVIESQLTITDMEEKIKHCTCEKDLCLSPSKKNSPSDKIKELKAICKKLKDNETYLKKENDSLLSRNKQLKDDNLKTVKMNEDFAVKNANLQKELTLVKKNVQNFETLSQDQKNLNEYVISIKEKHDKEIQCLKMEISKLSLENKRIKYLELECKHLKEQQNTKKAIKFDRLDFGHKTQDISAQHSTNPEIFLNNEKMMSLEVEPGELKNSLYVEMCSNSDSEDLVNDIFREMICPMALSPFSVSSSESPIPSNEPLQPLDDLEPIQVPNIIVTPPTPNIDKDNHVDKSFALPVAILEENKPKTEVEEQKKVVITEISCGSQAIIFNSSDSIDNHLVTNTVIHGNGIPITFCVTQKIKGTTNSENSTETESSKYIKENSKKKVINENTDEALLEKSKNLKKNEVIIDTNVCDQISDHTPNIVSPKDPVLFCKKSESTETDLRLANTNLITNKQNTNIVQLRKTSSVSRVQRKRKFWMPYNINTYVKVGKKRNKDKLSKVSKQYHTPNSAVPTDTILNALTTLQKHNINFTISNESIPLIQPYNCCTLTTPPKVEPKNTVRKFKDTFTNSLTGCWSKSCTNSNAQVLLRKVQHQDEPELLGFFNIKDEMVTPSVSRLDLPVNPEPLRGQDMVTQILNHINKLVNVSRNHSLESKRKKRTKTRNKRSDFYSETETELENLFTKSAVLERNKKFLATAKEQSFMSNGESAFDSESDVMIDSGLVTATPKTDGEILDSYDKYIINENGNLNNLSSIASSSNRQEINVVSEKNTNCSSVQNKNSAVFSLLPPPALIDKFKPISGFQVSSSPLQTYETNASSYSSPNSFKVPFCPNMISPMKFLKDSPINHTLKIPIVSDTTEDSLESFKMPFCPVMISPLTPNQNSSPNESNPVIENRAVNIFSALEKCNSLENNTDSTIDRFGTKSVYNGKLKSSLCQKLTFDSTAENNTLSKSFQNEMEIKNTTLCKISISEPSQVTKVDKDTSNKSFEIEKVELKAEQNNVSNTSETCDRLLYVDLSLHSEDLNCTLDDIHISQLDSSFDKSQNKVIKDETLAEEVIGLKCKTPNKDSSFKVESRYSLRRTSQCKTKKDESFKADTDIIISPKENTMNYMGPRTRSSKRKMEEQQTYDYGMPKSNKLVGPFKRKRILKKNVEETFIIPECKNKSSLITPSTENYDSKSKCNLETSNVILNIDKSVSLASNDNKCTEFLNKGQPNVYLTNNKDNKTINLNAGLRNNVESGIRENIAKIDSQQIRQEPYIKREKDGSKHDIVAERNCKKDKRRLNKKDNSNKFISKELISETESECDISFENDGKPMIQKGNNQNNTVNVKHNEIKEKILDIRSDSFANNSISKTQEETVEIQAILRNISKDGIISPVICSQDSKNKCLDNPILSESQLFGDFSDSDEDSSLTKYRKTGPPIKELMHKKTEKREKGLKKKILNQVKDLVYGYGNKRVNRTTLDTPKEATGSISHTTNSSSIDKNKRINVVQNILITKGHMINLLPEVNHSENSRTAEKSILPTIVSKQTSLISHPRRKPAFEQTNSNGTSVDILSEVMKGMVRTGPKTCAKKNTLKQVNRSIQGKLQVCNSVNITVGIPPETAVKQSKSVTKPMTNDKDAEHMECPKSPEVIEVPDRFPKLIPPEKPCKLPPSKVRVLMDKLMIFSDETKMHDDIIREFAFQEIQFMAEIIIAKVSRDCHDKADMLFPSSPPMTSTQRTLLGFLLKLEKSTHPGIMDKFLSLAELNLFNKNLCTLQVVQPITRLYTAVCKVRSDLHRIRRFMCDGFYFMDDFAIPMFFTLLTMWPEVLPVASETLGSSGNLLAKVIVQISLLKDCNKPGYNLLPLKDMLNKFFGYPIERWECEGIFREIMVEYIRNPSLRLSDFTLLLFLRNKPAKWAYEKVKQNIIPLYKQVADSNPNLKATLLILVANICCTFQRHEEQVWSVIHEIEEWFKELDKDDLDPIIKRSIHLAKGRIPRKPVTKKKKNNTANKATVNESGNMSDENCQKEQNCVKEIKGIEDSRQCNNSDSNSVELRTIGENSNKTSTNDSVNINSTLDHREKTNCKNKFDNLTQKYDLSNSISSDFSDIEF